MLTLVTGPDAFLARNAVNRIRQQYDPDGLNTSTPDARSTTVPEIIAAVGTPGFFGTRRVVVVYDLMTLASRGGSAEDGSDAPTKAAKSAVDWPALFAAVQRSNVAVFVDRELTTVPAAIKRAAPAGTEYVSGDPPRGVALVAWMKEQARASESSIADMDARVLAEMLSPGTWSAKPANPAYDRPPDLDLFANEIAKLALAAHPEPIGRAHIAAMTAAGRADRLFPLIDAVVASEGAGALRELGAAMSNGDDAGRIGAQLFQQVELIAAMDAAGRTDPIEAGRALGLQNPNRMLNVSRGMRSMRGRPDRMLAGAVQTERQFKRGVLRQPADQIYALVERLLSSQRTTESGT